ncbi:nucleotidyltransferase domain-containing protein [Sphingobium sp. SA2]|uniref:nucleotidyltransferase family protein n=1 Tax=Sphingobium sp. SA2 TaxID=1524832 RepID=UPI0028C373FD|nr:nucleotidyltransferase domain-containing protein [Sphingobium sp. SA2]MDT7533253.1 nucleotidyltransferase domain-containing protein [Sphingobium sp. SA2]
MTREEAIARIKPHEAELRAAGITSLALFGSVARGEARADSDVDLMCEIDKTRVHDLLDFIGIQLRLKDIVGQQVDLVQQAFMRPRIAQNAAKDQIRVF